MGVKHPILGGCVLKTIIQPLTQENTRMVAMPHGLMRATELALRHLSSALKAKRLVPDQEHSDTLRNGLTGLENSWPSLPEVAGEIQEHDVLTALATEIKARNQGHL